MLYPQILSKNQQEALEKLGVLGENYYLAGGTGLALQLGHRTSLDFDFYSDRHFDNLKLVKKLSKKIASNFKADENQPKNTLFAEIRGIKMSIFYYPYQMVDKLVNYPPVKLASISDISAMKIAAIIQRGRQRDFVDLYFLLGKLGLGKILEATYQKYPWYKEMGQIIFKALTYFSDADQDKEIERVKIISPNFSWDNAKEKISQEVKKYQLSMFEK